MKKILCALLAFPLMSYASLSFSVDDQEISIAEQFINTFHKKTDVISPTQAIKDEKKEKKENKQITKKVQEESKKLTYVNPPYNPQIIGKIYRGETCWDAAGKYHNLDPWLLYSIAYVESGFNPDAIGKNTNGTVDIGIMQINNKVWLPKLNKMGITRAMLREPCLSIYVGAWILKQNINEFGYTAKAIGAYNSRTPDKNRKYARKVYDAYAKFTKLYKIQAETVKNR